MLSLERVKKKSKETSLFFLIRQTEYPKMREKSGKGTEPRSEELNYESRLQLGVTEKSGGHSENLGAFLAH